LILILKNSQNPFLKKDYTSALVSVYKSLGSAEAEPQIEKAAQNKEELKPFAKAYLFRSALKAAWP
jgi:hypothetical protein